MKTEEEIKQEIKKRIQNSWKYGNKESRQRARCGCDALIWVLYGYSNRDYCPHRGEIIYCDEVDIGWQQCGPYHCGSCGTSEVHPDDKLLLNEDEEETGFYKNRISPIANQTNDGKLVNHKQASELYPLGMLKNCKPSYFVQKEEKPLNFLNKQFKFSAA